MKRITPHLLLTFITLFSSHSLLHAQVAKVLGAGGSTVGAVININKYSARISNLYTRDSLKVPYLAVFELDLNSSPDSKNLLTSLFNAILGNQSLPITFRKLNIQGQVMEERTYNAATVEEIELPDLNTSSKEGASVKVTILSPEVVTRTDINEPGPGLSKQSRDLLTSNFKITLGALPAARVSAISNLRINRQSGGYLNFNVTVVRIDSKNWKDWFNKGAGGGQRMDGTISFMDNTMQNALITLQIAGVEIMSVSETDNGQESVARTTVGLRTRKIEISK